MKQPEPKVDLWTADTSAATYSSGNSIEVDVKNYAAQYLGQTWDQQTKTSLEMGLEDVVKNYIKGSDTLYTKTRNKDEYIWDYTNCAADSTDIKYNIVTSAGNDLWYTAPGSDNTITMTGNAGLYIATDNNTATSASTQMLNIKPLTKEERFREQLRKRIAPQILFRRFGVGRTTKDSEKKAREALRAIIGDQRFRRYLKHGFLTVRGESGFTYQIFPGHKMTHVWRNGTPVEKLCVIFCDSSVPPTDSVIMRLLMILDSEEEFRNKSNVMKFTSHDIKQPIHVAA